MATAIRLPQVLFSHPGNETPKPYRARPRPTGEAELTRRYEEGRDLWSGAALDGLDAWEWLRSRFHEDDDDDGDYSWESLAG